MHISRIQELEAKLATARVCEKCGGKFKDVYHQPGMIHYITDSDDERCPPYHWRDCPHCTNGVQLSDERARQLLEECDGYKAQRDALAKALRSQPCRCKCLTHGFGCGIEEATCQKDYSYKCSRCEALTTLERIICT